MSDKIKHPSHYTSLGVEVYDIAKHLSFTEGNIVKYLLRAPFKEDFMTDCKKALEYFTMADGDRPFEYLNSSDGIDKAAELLITASAALRKIGTVSGSHVCVAQYGLLATVVAHIAVLLQVHDSYNGNLIRSNSRGAAKATLKVLCEYNDMVRGIPATGPVKEPTIDGVRDDGRRLCDARAIKPYYVQALENAKAVHNG